MEFNNIYKTIGRTPLVKLNNMITEDMADIWVKVEFLIQVVVLRIDQPYI